MRPIAINFAWRRERRHERAGYLFLVLALVAAFGTAWRGVELQRELDARRAERQGLQRTSEASVAVALSSEDAARQLTELKTAQSVIERLDTPWGALFAAVESAFDDHVTLLSVEPEPERREVRLTAEAKDLQAMQAYIRQLRQSPALRDVYLASHQVNQQDPLRPVRFAASARWVVPSENASSTTTDGTAKEASVAGSPPAEKIPTSADATAGLNPGNENASATAEPTGRMAGN